jgi:ligand-binding sensor domain-containing protein
VPRSATLLTLALLWPAADALALDRPLPACTVEVWRAKDGLPGDQVRALAQTPDGRLWAATLGGIVRFDGRQWTTVGQPALPGGASDPTGLAAAGDGSVWILGRRGFWRLQGEAGTSLGALEGAPADVRAFAERGRQSWVAGADGIYRFSDGRFTRLVAAPEGAQLTALHADADGALWVGTTRGLWKLAGGQLQRVPAIAQ